MEPEVYMNQSLLNKAMTDKWQAIIPVPDVLANVDLKKFTNIPVSENNISSNTFLFSLERVNTPKIRIASKNVPYSGQTMKISSHARTDLDDLEIEFKIDNRFSNYLYIYKWLDVLHNEMAGIYDEHNIAPNTYEKPPGKEQQILRMLKYYSVDLTVTHLDEYEKPVINFKYYGAFPTSLSNIRFSYQDPTKISCTATFSYSQFKIEPLVNIQGIVLPTTTTTISTTPTPTTTTVSTTTSTTTAGDPNVIC